MFSEYNFVSVENCPEYLLFIFEGTQWCRTNTIISNFCKIPVMEKWGNSLRNVPWNLRFTEIFYTLLLLQRSDCNYNISYTDPRWDVCVSFVEIFVKCLPGVRILLLLQSGAAAQCDGLTDIDEVETLDTFDIFSNSNRAVSTYHYKPHTDTTTRFTFYFKIIYQSHNLF